MIVFIAKSKSGAPMFENLPPTDESFFQDLERSHLQIAAWRCSLNADPPPTVHINL